MDYQGTAAGNPFTEQTLGKYFVGREELEMFSRSLQGLQQQPRMVSECMNGMTWGSQ